MLCVMAQTHAASNAHFPPAMLLLPPFAPGPAPGYWLRLCPILRLVRASPSWCAAEACSCFPLGTDCTQVRRRDDHHSLPPLTHHLSKGTKGPPPSLCRVVASLCWPLLVPGNPMTSSPPPKDSQEARPKSPAPLLPSVARLPTSVVLGRLLSLGLHRLHLQAAVPGLQWLRLVPVWSKSECCTA